MTAVAPEGQKTTFYNPDIVNRAEAERLDLMAAYADQISLGSLGRVLDTPGAIVVDVGAGDSTSLGAKLIERNPLAHYTPVDIRGDALQNHWDAGFDARIGQATALPALDNSADALHARFTFGWLSQPERTKAVNEMLRVGHNQATLAIIDYDWGSARGPEPVDRLVHFVSGLMQKFGFDPNYGAQVAEDIQNTLRSHGHQAATFQVVRNTVIEPLERALGTVEATVEPLLNTLEKAGLQEHVNTLRTLLGDVQKYTAQYPNAVIHFPDIVSVTAGLRTVERSELSVAQLQTGQAVGAESLREEVLKSVGPAILEAYELPESKKREGRRLHAQAFRKHGHVTEEGIQEGVLIEELDPQHIIDRSTYIGRFNEEEQQTGNIRVIEGDARSLPTVAKIVEALGEDSPILADLPFLQQGKVGEASALARAEYSIDKLELPKLLLAAICLAKEQDYDYLVTGIVKSVARMLVGGYGEKAFRRIDGEAATIQLTGKGIKSEGVTLVPFYVDVNTFVDDCLSHIDQQLAKSPDDPYLQQVKTLFEETNSFMRKAA